jgi:hypothetical protein
MIRFHVLRSRTRFSAMRRASGPVFMFYAPGLVFGVSEGVGSHFHSLLSPTLFRQYRGRRDPFSSFARPDSFSTVPRASAPVFMFSTPKLIFGGTDGVGSLFHVFAPGHVLGGAKGVGSRFHVLCFRTRFRLRGGRRVRFSCFALPDTFPAVRRALGPVFMFGAPELVSGGF